MAMPFDQKSLTLLSCLGNRGLRNCLVGTLWHLECFLLSKVTKELLWDAARIAAQSLRWNSGSSFVWSRRLAICPRVFLTRQTIKILFAAACDSTLVSSHWRDFRRDPVRVSRLVRGRLGPAAFGRGASVRRPVQYRAASQ